MVWGWEQKQNPKCALGFWRKGRQFKMKQYKVGVVGATGMVGQRFITLLENHPGLSLRLWLHRHAPQARPMRMLSAAAG